MRPSRNVLLTILAGFFAGSPLIGQQIPVRNWTVPAFDATAIEGYGRDIRSLSHTQGDHPALFVPLGPCRLTDSRISSGGPGPIPASGTRDYDFVPDGCPYIEGLQTDQAVSEPIIAWSLNFTVLNTQGPGFLFAYPTGGTPPAVSILNYTGVPGELRNNAAIVPVNETTGSFSVTAGVSGTDVIIDVNGVFLNGLEIDTGLRITGSYMGGVIEGVNSRATSGSAGIQGSHLGSGIGVRGIGAAGVSGIGTGRGVFGQATGIGHGSTGVKGVASSGSGYHFGVEGETDSQNGGSAGVKGISGYGDPLLFESNCQPCFNAGVRGVDAGQPPTFSYGILGISRNTAIKGVRLGATGTFVTYAGALASNGYGVYASGDYGGTGAKYFVEPHPSDPSLVIKYISLEGPEAGTYFRGRGKFERGMATIDVPEDFRMVTDTEGLSIQVTALGGMATYGVLSISLDRIVVQGSRDIEFFYTVNGVRRTFKDQRPIQKGSGEYTPDAADATLPAWLSDEQKRLLIRNGTYKEDGTVNMETARRMGWDKMWESARKRGAPELSSR